MNNSPAAAFADRINALTPKIQRAARAAVGSLSEHDADDLYQTAILKLWERVQQDPSFAQRPDAELVTFATWRARHKASLGRIYSKYVEGETVWTDDDGEETSNFELIPAAGRTPEDAYIAREEIDNLQTAINALPPRQRQFAILLYQGYSQSEAAQQMGISKPTAHEMKVAIARKLSGLRPA